MRNAQKQKILILSSSTGEGHNSAAYAIAAVFEENGVQTEVRDVLSFKSARAQRLWTKAYANCINYAPRLFGFIYGLGKICDKCRFPSPVYAYNSSYADKLNCYIADNGFTDVICTHLYAMNAMTAVRRKYGRGVKCYGILTDYTTVPFYRNTDLDTYFAADETVRKQLIACGIPAERVSVTGIPVHPKFNVKIDKTQAREQLGIPQNKRVVAVMTGGTGCGKLNKLCGRLYKCTGDDCLIQVFTGRNERLKCRLDKKYGKCGKVQAVEFTDKVHLYLRACDVLVSKPGGLSSTEAAVVNVPFVQLATLPGLEVSNMKKFTGCGMARGERRIVRAVNSVCDLLENGNEAETMCNVQRTTIYPASAQRIADKISEEGGYEHVNVVTVYNGGVRVG